MQPAAAAAAPPQQELARRGAAANAALWELPVYTRFDGVAAVPLDGGSGVGGGTSATARLQAAKKSTASPAGAAESVLGLSRVERRRRGSEEWEPYSTLLEQKRAAGTGLTGLFPVAHIARDAGSKVHMTACTSALCVRLCFFWRCYATVLWHIGSAMLCCCRAAGALMDCAAAFFRLLEWTHRCPAVFGCTRRTSFTLATARASVASSRGRRPSVRPPSARDSRMAAGRLTAVST